MTTRASGVSSRPGLAELVTQALSINRNDNVVEGAIVALRVVTGVTIATAHGWHKVVQGWQYLTSGAQWPLLDDTVQLGFPAPVVLAIAAALSQFVGGWLLALGILTRLAALMVAGTMIVALLFNLWFDGPDAQLAGLYALVAATFAVTGGTRWSVFGPRSRTTPS
jgi:putative oxidoreductase